MWGKLNRRLQIFQKPKDIIVNRHNEVRRRVRISTVFHSHCTPPPPSWQRVKKIINYFTNFIVNNMIVDAAPTMLLYR
jgi:hypothetical protein